MTAYQTSKPGTGAAYGRRCAFDDPQTLRPQKENQHMTRKTATLKSQPTSPPKDEPPSATVITFPLLKVSDNVEAIARVLSAMPPEDFSRAFMKLAADRSDLLVRDATFSKQVDDLWAWYYGILDARDRLKGVKRGRPITT